MGYYGMGWFWVGIVRRRYCWRLVVVLHKGLTGAQEAFTGSGGWGGRMEDDDPLDCQVRAIDGLMLSEEEEVVVVVVSQSS